MRMARVIWHYEAWSGDSECFQAPCRVGSTPKTMMTPRLTKKTLPLNWSRCCCRDTGTFSLHHNPIFGLEIDTLICEHVINPIPILGLWNMQMNLSFDSGPYSASCIEKLISPPITRPLLPGGDGDLNWIRVPGPSSVHGRLSKVKVWCCKRQEHENGIICDKKIKTFLCGRLPDNYNERSAYR